MKGYKVLNPDWTCRGQRFKLGKTISFDGEPILCKQGFHFCTQLSDCFSYYRFNPQNIVCEVKAAGIITESELNCSKRACQQITLTRQLAWEEVLQGCNLGQANSGYHNTGDHNSGNYNSGNRNSGCYNSGYRNSGHYNSGDHNSGNYNSGNRNSGYRNSGHYNSGNYNSGDNNSGYCNSGNYNSGDYNSGSYNTGDYNSGDYNSGYFNTTEPTVRMFNCDTGLRRSQIQLPLIDLPLHQWILPADMTNQQRADNPGYTAAGGFLLKRTYKEAWKVWWKTASKEDKQQIKSLPNFDAAVFKELTGITVKIRKS